MFLLSVYFDETSNRILERYIQEIARTVGNDFMLKNKVPPHMTIAAVEARNKENLILNMEKIRTDKFFPGEIEIVSIGALFPYVLYATPVLNNYLIELSKKTYDIIQEIPDVHISKYYRPYQWLPHITLGKTLEKNQLTQAFQVMQERFVPFRAEIVKIGLTKTNPHENIWMIEL